MKYTCVCCNKTKDKISRILYSKDECELQVIFYYKLPTEIIRTIGEYLYQPELIKINHRTKKLPKNYSIIQNDIIEYNITYNCSCCFLYNFIIFKKQNPNKMPRLRNDIHWFNNRLEKKQIISLFDDYFCDIFKFILPIKYNMYFFRSHGLTIVKTYQTSEIYPYVIPPTSEEKIFNNDKILKIFIPEK